ncbi:MAG: hypothetical protein AAGF15_05315, partial [Pseudomonadota bacterium]
HKQTKIKPASKKVQNKINPVQSRQIKPNQTEPPPALPFHKTNNVKEQNAPYSVQPVGCIARGMAAGYMHEPRGCQTPFLRFFGAPAENRKKLCISIF